VNMCVCVLNTILNLQNNFISPDCTQFLGIILVQFWLPYINNYIEFKWLICNIMPGSAGIFLHSPMGGGVMTPPTQLTDDIQFFSVSKCFKMFFNVNLCFEHV